MQGFYSQCVYIDSVCNWNQVCMISIQVMIVDCDCRLPIFWEVSFWTNNKNNIYKCKYMLSKIELIKLENYSYNIIHIYYYKYYYLEFPISIYLLYLVN